jgi:hypothetical protein
VGGEKSDEDDGDKAEEKGKSVDRDGDDSDEVGDESGNEDEDMFEEKDAPVIRFGPPKVAKGHSGSGHVKSVAHHDRQDAMDATLASSIDSNILFFVTVFFY